MRLTVNSIKEMKHLGKKIPMLTAYDYTSARLIEEAGVDFILVGDSLGQVILGYQNTIPVTMEEMLHHTKAVVRGTNQALVVADMPFLTYHLSHEQALHNAGRFLQEGGAQAVKLEGGVRMRETVQALTRNGIPVLGHIGLTPQSINQLGGTRVQGKTKQMADEILTDAKAIEEAGAFAVVVELVPEELGRLITEGLSIPTIGIGAGVHCDGQVLVFHDMLGMSVGPVPRHAKAFANLGSATKEAVGLYLSEVRSGQFPTANESFVSEGSDGASARVKAERLLK